MKNLFRALETLPLHDTMRFAILMSANGLVDIPNGLEAQLSSRPVVWG
jgi:hypothetical protein